MSEITLGQIQNVLLFITGFGGAVAIIIRAIKKIINSALQPLTKKLDSLTEDNKKNGDMIYQMLDHLATNNNSGGMKKALDEYNSYYRRR